MRGSIYITRNNESMMTQAGVNYSQTSTDWQKTTWVSNISDKVYAAWFAKAVCFGRNLNRQKRRKLRLPTPLCKGPMSTILNKLHQKKKKKMHPC